MTVSLDGCGDGPAGLGATASEHSGASGATPGHYDPGAFGQLGGSPKSVSHKGIGRYAERAAEVQSRSEEVPSRGVQALRYTQP
jgi:hypothetical protein